METAFPALKRRAILRMSLSGQATDESAVFQKTEPTAGRRCGKPVSCQQMEARIGVWLHNAPGHDNALPL
jgi:hypothetical protein